MRTHKMKIVLQFDAVVTLLWVRKLRRCAHILIRTPIHWRILFEPLSPCVWNINKSPNMWPMSCFSIFLFVEIKSYFNCTLRRCSQVCCRVIKGIDGNANNLLFFLSAFFAFHFILNLHANWKVNNVYFDLFNKSWRSLSSSSSYSIESKYIGRLILSHYSIYYITG